MKSIELNSEDIYDNQGRLLLKKGAPVNEETIKKLKRYGVDYRIFEEIPPKNDELNHNLYYSDYLTKELHIDSTSLNTAVSLVNGTILNTRKNPLLYVKLAALFSHSDWVYSHCINVALLSALIAIGAGLSQKPLELLTLGAIFHDIGKTLIPSSILNKGSALTENEYEIIKQHPLLGCDMVKEDNLDPLVNNIILQHHERLDGSGYPYGLMSENIYICPKIVAIANVFDALSTDRPYRKAYGIEESLVTLEHGAGLEFDKDMVAVFKKIAGVL